MIPAAPAGNLPMPAARKGVDTTQSVPFPSQFFLGAPVSAAVAMDAERSTHLGAGLSDVGNRMLPEINDGLCMVRSPKQDSKCDN
jgi:hypothetical protein